jgi:hypothetical protein
VKEASEKWRRGDVRKDAVRPVVLELIVCSGREAVQREETSSSTTSSPRRPSLPLPLVPSPSFLSPLSRSVSPQQRRQASSQPAAPPVLLASPPASLPALVVPESPRTTLLSAGLASLAFSCCFPSRMPAASAASPARMSVSRQFFEEQVRPLFSLDFPPRSLTSSRHRLPPSLLLLAPSPPPSTSFTPSRRPSVSSTPTLPQRLNSPSIFETLFSRPPHS